MGLEGTDVTEPSARQLELVGPGRLPGRGEWCWLEGTGPKEKRRRISIRGTGLRGQKRQRGGPCPKGPQAPLGEIDLVTDMPLGCGEWEKSRVTQSLLEELSG